MKTIVFTQFGKETGRLKLSDSCVVTCEQDGVAEIIEPNPPEPEPFSFEHVQRTPGVWRHCGNYGSFRIVTFAPCVAVGISNGLLLKTIGEHWRNLHDRYIPAPERLEDVRVVFDGK